MKKFYKIEIYLVYVNVFKGFGVQLGMLEGRISSRFLQGVDMSTKKTKSKFGHL